VTKGKRTEIVDADLKDYFNTIPHGELLKCLARRTCDKNILGLAKAWLVAPVAERGSKGRISMTTVAKNEI
jgi:retron-type reverse transcriptase